MDLWKRLAHISRHAQPGGYLAEIEQILQGGARQVAPSDWLRKLFGSRQLDIESAREYLAQSPYYKNRKWDIPRETEEVESERERDPDRSYHRYDNTLWTMQTNDRENEDDEDDEEEDEDEDEEEDEDNDEEEDEDEDGWTDPWEEANDRLQQRLMDIFNDVLLYFGLNKSRKALATNATSDEQDDVHYRYEKRGAYGMPRFSTRPDLIVLGEDSRQLPRAIDSYHRGMSILKEDRVELYRGCVAVGKVEKMAGNAAKCKMLEKLATAAEYASF